eukprot:3653966-Amphidinium_carterae.1
MCIRDSNVAIVVKKLGVIVIVLCDCGVRDCDWATPLPTIVADPHLFVDDQIVIVDHCPPVQNHWLIVVVFQIIVRSNVLCVEFALIVQAPRKHCRQTIVFTPLSELIANVFVLSIVIAE